MRKIIMVRVERFDIDDCRNKINEIVHLYTEYLNEYPAKTTKSKHGVMGPIAKILKKVKTGKYDAGALIGEALRVHDMNEKTHRYISNNARVALEQGTEIIVWLCKKIPATAVDKVIEQIDHKIYYALRKKTLLYFETIRQEFIEFLKAKYSGVNDLSKAWGDKKFASFEQVKYPSKNAGSKSSNPTYRQDADDFWVAKKSEPEYEED